MAKEVERNLESTMVEVAEDKENIFSLPCPLPPSTYKAADRNSETKHPAGHEYRYIPEAYGQVVNSEARVTKHVARRQIEVEQAEDSSSLVDVSVLETRVVRKFATPLAPHKLARGTNN